MNIRFIVYRIYNMEISYILLYIERDREKSKRW